MTGKLLEELRLRDMKRYVERHGFWPSNEYYKSLAQYFRERDPGFKEAHALAKKYRGEANKQGD